MTVELVQMLSLISFIVAGVLFLVAVALFLLYLNYAGLIEIISSTPFNIVLLCFVIVLTACLLICSVGVKNENNLQKTG